MNESINQIEFIIAVKWVKRTAALNPFSSIIISFQFTYVELNEIEWLMEWLSREPFDLLIEKK